MCLDWHWELSAHSVQTFAKTGRRLRSKSLADVTKSFVDWSGRIEVTPIRVPDGALNPAVGSRFFLLTVLLQTR